MLNIIPVMHCFDNNFVIPASVAFYSMLENSNPQYTYKLYVLHSDIKLDNQLKLQELVNRFANATLEFIDMQNKFDDLFAKTTNKHHYSKEMFYKFLVASIFPQYDKIMVVDVDVVYLSDVAKIFNSFDIEEDIYFSGFRGFVLKDSWVEKVTKDDYMQDYSENDVNKLLTGAGYIIFNLKRMRIDNIEDKLINYALDNVHRLRQPEQDTLNLVCYPKISFLPVNSVVCTYMYELYRTEEDFNNDLYHKAEDIKFALKNPIQLHYAGNNKPWNTLDCTKADVWFRYLAKTEFLVDFLNLLAGNIKKSKVAYKKILTLNIPFLKRKIFIAKTPKCR